jgi:hypothetical protein
MQIVNNEKIVYVCFNTYSISRIPLQNIGNVVLSKDCENRQNRQHRDLTQDAVTERLLSPHSLMNTKYY